ncbi:MAG TPA: hypothetical protein VD767_07070 [Thermomicrobiales bacterium]|nr:hypothetical protein [Thermomicrobiales bacterium]
MSLNLPVIAGLVSTVIFATSTLPMLLKAWRTRDLHSYSFGMLALANSGNLVHSVYVFSLPMGPIWALHTFHLITTGLMLAWYLLFEAGPRRQSARRETRVEIDAPLDDLLMVGR